MKKSHMLVLLIAASGLAGCATTQDSDLEAKRLAEQQAEMDRVLQKRLSDSADSINGTLQLIEKIERGSVGGPNGYREGETPDHALEQQAEQAKAAAAAAAAAAAEKDPLDARMRVVWKKGSAEDLLRQMAKQMGADFRVVSAPVGGAPLVTLQAENQSVREILTSVGKQIDAKADIVFVAAKPSVLELRYK